MTTEADTETDPGTDPEVGTPSPRSRPLRAPGTAAAGSSATATKRAGATPSGIAARRASAPPSRPLTAAGRPDGGRGRRLPWILAVLGLVGTVAFAGLWLAGRGDGPSGTSGADDGATMQEAADGFARALTNFDGSSIDADFDRIVARSTGDFRDEVDQFFSADTRKELKEAQASSRGEVRSSYVQGVDGDRGSVFLVLDQTIANNRSPQPKADTLRMEVALRRVSGRWLVQQVNVLEAPSGGATIPGGATTTTAPAGSAKGD